MTGFDPAPAKGLLDLVAEFDLWQQVGELAIAGYTVLPEVLSHEETAGLRSLACDLLTGPVALQDPCGHRVWNLLKHNRTFLRLLEDDRVNVLLTVLLGEGAVLSSMHINAITPGAAAQECHVDTPFVPGPLPATALLANTIWCLNTWREGQGATEACPGSHLVRSPAPDADASMVPIECPAGSVIITNGAVWHRSGAYDQQGVLPRIGVLALYCRSFVVTQERYDTVAAQVDDARLAARLGRRSPYPFGAEGPDQRFADAQLLARSPFA